ncbi:MAG: hypothetical protein JKY43_00665 [Phycisphaerales bacterium]|nr:hypothetical protein [Phycisphaerales bacterium]
MKLNQAIILATITVLTAGTNAGITILEDGNSSASFDTVNGQYSWTVDGIEHLYAQEFYFRLAGDNDEANISTLDMIGQSASDTNGFSDTRLDALNTAYTNNAGLEIDTFFTLRGGTPGSGNSSITEQITLTNTSNSAISLSFFQYVDFDLGGDDTDDWGQIVDGNVAQQFDDEYAISETVVTPFPSAFEMGDYNVLSDYWNNGQIDNLNGDSFYQGDVAWAFQWDITLQAGDSFLISKNKSIVPTPASIALLTAAGLLGTRRRRA